MLERHKLKSIPYNEDFSREISRIRKIISQDIKLEYCYHCGKKESSFCNSHFIPSFILKNIAENGQVKSIGGLISMPADKGKKGVKGAGTFKLICRSCDSKIFQTYESIKYYSKSDLTNKVLSEISMKINLKLISKRFFEQKLYEKMEKYVEKSSIGNPFFYVISEQKLGASLDLQEYAACYRFACKNQYGKHKNSYKLLYYRKLHYNVCIVVQDIITLVCDLKGRMINNIYDFTGKDRVKPFYLCVFPLEEFSVVFAFVEQTNKRYSTFFSDLKKRSIKEQLEILNYLIFDKTEDYYISPSVDTSSLVGLASNTELIESTKHLNDKESIKVNTRDYFNPIKWKGLKNLLMKV